MDFSRLKTSDLVILGSALVLFIASFLEWFKVEGSGEFGFVGEVGGENGWGIPGGAFWAGLPVLIGLAMAAYVLIRAFAPQTQLPAAPWGTVLLAAGAAAAAIVLLKLLIGVDDEGAGAFGFEVKRAFGLFIATLAALGLAAGGFLKFQEEKAGGGTTATGTAPPTPF